MKEQLAKAMLQCLQTLFPDLTIVETDIQFQTPKNKENGDFASNIAMQLTKKVGLPPRDVANQITSVLEQDNIVDRIEIAGPGFINFFLKKADIFANLDEMIQQGAAYGQQTSKDKAINLEYVSVNPTGDLHIGHARGAVYGDVIGNILRKTGHDVTKEYYINDAGSQIQKLGVSTEIRYRQLLGEDVAMIEDGYHAADIIEIAKSLHAEHGTELETMTDATARLQFISDYALKAELVKIKADLDEIAIHHDVWFSERTLYASGAINKVLNRLKERAMVYESEGALWLKSTLYGDDKDRVLIKTDGSYTYLTPDIAYHVDKIERLNSENRGLIDILGGDHHGYVARMKAALQTLGYPEDILRVRLIQMVRFMQDGKEVKMSKRTGNLITMRELVEEVGADAVRYYFSMRNCDTPLDFDMDLAKEESNNNPVYYAQYAHARICSILRNLEELLNIDVATFEYTNDYGLLTEEKERELANKLNQYTDVLELAANRLEPFKITNYIQELAATFHGFYNAVRVIDSENFERTVQRTKLLLATRAVLQSAFAIIGISAPEVM